VYVAMMRVPRSMLDASADLGARHLRQLASVTLPLARPGIATGAVLVGVLSVGEFIVPSILGGNKVLLLGNILAERGAGRDQPLGGAITAFMVLVFALVGLGLLIARRRQAAHG
jgi:ABC-type spermidine/putrescine transport system permease subunit I